MAFSAGASGGRNDQSFSNTGLTGQDSGGWAEPEKDPRDLKKIILVIGLGALSWAATYIGMLELIQANVGDLPIVHKLLIAFSVAMLMTMIIWLLDQIFRAGPASTKFLFVIGYVFLSVISVGFGFGFYWKVLESRSESTRSAESAISGVQNSLHAGFIRMQQLNQTLVELEKISSAKAVEEREKGTSCPNSRPGDGPRRKLRDADAASFRFASQFVTRRVGSVKTDLGALKVDLTKVASGDASTFDAKSGTRNDFLRDLNRRLDLTVTGFNAFRTDPQLRQIRSDLNDRAGKTVFPNGSRTFSCPDPQLQAALRGVVRAIDQLPEMTKPQIAAVEGSEATIEAFRRLTASIMGVLTFSPPLTPDELRRLQKKAVQSVSGSGSSTPPAYAAPTGLGKRDYVPLAIAIFVDLCLLLVSIGRPMNKLNNLIPKMREAEKGPVIQILSRFNEIHRDPEIRQNFEVFRHVVFDYLGDYYVAVPLDTPYNRVANSSAPSYGTAQAQELQDEAHLLSNLFASFEKEKIFKRVYFVPTRVVRNRLHRQGSKFSGSSAFRLYRFKDGAWSDIILGAVMGAAKRVEAEKAQRQALLERQIEQTGPTLNSQTTAPDAANSSPKKHPLAAHATKVGLNGTGEAGPSGKTPPHVLQNTSAKPTNGASLNGASLNGFHANGHASSAAGINGNGAPAMFGSAMNGAIFIDEDFGGEEFDESEIDDLALEDEDQIRSRYGKYADKILAERTYTVTSKTGTLTTEANNDSDGLTDEMPDIAAPDLKSAAANSNTMPAIEPQDDSTITLEDITIESSAPDVTQSVTQNVIALPASQSGGNDMSLALVPRQDDANEHKVDGVIARSNEPNDPSATLSPAKSGETTVTLTRETATYTVPVSEAVLPIALQQSAVAGQRVVLSQAVLKDDADDFAQPEHVVIDTLAQAIPMQDESAETEQADSTEQDTPTQMLTPPPLPDA